MRRFLIVVDMQNDFIDGALGTAEAQDIVPKVQKKIRQYQPQQIIATRDTHQKDYLKTAEGKYLPVEHCIQGSHGWEIREEIARELSSAVVIDKPTFGSGRLAEYLISLAGQESGDGNSDHSESTCPDKGQGMEIELVGLCTDICVVTNALLLKTALPDAVIRVDGACCAGVTPKSHKAALLTMKMCQVEVTE